MFVALGTYGYSSKRIDDAGRVVQEEGGAHKGLAFWEPPVRTILTQFFEETTYSDRALIKTLDSQTHPFLAPLLKERQDGSWPPLPNVCVF